MKTFAILASTLVTTAIAAPATQSCPVQVTEKLPHCRDLLVPIQASANNTLFPAYPNSTAPGAIYDYISSLKFPDLKPFGNTVKGSFNISVRYCEPTVKVAGREDTIQVLLHGLSYTKSYWNGLNFPHPDFSTEYSWIDHAASQGYATLSIDSLGNGLSSRPDPLNMVQIPLQVAVLRQIILSLRSASISTIPTAYKKVILGSYSFGSIVARTLATSYPDSGADAYVLTAAAKNLTGFNGAFVALNAQAASVLNPTSFHDLSPGYVAASPSGIRPTLYSFEADFSPKVVEWDAASPHVFAVGEIASGALAPTFPSDFTGPVLVVTGRYDQISCGTGDFLAGVADCGVGPGSNPDEARVYFPKSRNFESYIVDRSGHSVNTHYSAPEAFGAAHLWLESVGF